MRKIVILLIALMVISVGFLSGCEESTNYGDDGVTTLSMFIDKRETASRRITWMVSQIEGAPVADNGYTWSLLDSYGTEDYDATLSFNDKNDDNYINAGDNFVVTASSTGYYVLEISRSPIGYLIFKSAPVNYAIPNYPIYRHTVELEVTGSTVSDEAYVDLSYTFDDRTYSYDYISLPWSRKTTRAEEGEWYYVYAQNNGEYLYIEATITIDGRVVETDISYSDYGVVSVGSFV